MERKLKKEVACLLVLVLSMLTFPALAASTGYGIWEQGSYVDEFRDPTGEYYVCAKASGTFSNNFTTDSELNVMVLVDVNGVSFQLYEYGNMLVRGIYDREDFTILMKGDKWDDKFSLTGYMLKGSDCLFIDFGESTGEFYRAFNLNESGRMRFVIKSEKDPADEYRFTFDDISGFYDACDEYLSGYAVEPAKAYGIEVGTKIIHKTYGEATVTRVYTRFIAGNGYQYCPMMDIQLSDGTVKEKLGISAVIENGIVKVK